MAYSGGRARARRRRVVIIAATVGILAIAATAIAPAARAAENQADPYGFGGGVAVQATNGAGRINNAGLPCAEGGDGAYWHYDYGAPLAPDDMSVLPAPPPAELRLHLDLHSEDSATRTTPVDQKGQPVPPSPPRKPNAFLQGQESHASLVTERGTVKLRLQSGTCDSPTLSFDGTTASGAGTWSVDTSSGAYRQATGNGAFTVAAGVAPGADNPFQLQLDGGLQILQPGLQVCVRDAYWGLLGVDYLLRRLTVIYQISNPGPGDAFGAQFVDATSTTAHRMPVTATQVPRRKLGDLMASGPASCPQRSEDPLQALVSPPPATPPPAQSELVRVRYQLPLSDPPCSLVVLECAFDAAVQVDMPDAFDRPEVKQQTVTVRVPNFPPPIPTSF